MNEAEWFEYENAVRAWRHRLSPRDYKAWNSTRTLLKVASKDLEIIGDAKCEIAQSILKRLCDAWLPLTPQEYDEDYYSD